MIDMHCDTLWKLIDLDGQGNLMKNDCHISIPSMKKAGTVVQLFACFTQAADYKKKGGYDAAFVHVQDMVRYLRRQQEMYSEDLTLAYSWNDVDRNEHRCIPCIGWNIPGYNGNRKRNGDCVSF